MSNKRQMGKLRARLKVLTEETLPKALKKYGVAVAENQDVRENAFATQTEEEIAVIRAEIISIRKDILKLQREKHDQDQ